MNLPERLRVLGRLTGSGVYRHQFAALLVWPLRRLVLSPLA
jgi:hypothetical protein